MTEFGVGGWLTLFGANFLGCVLLWSSDGLLDKGVDGSALGGESSSDTISSERIPLYSDAKTISNLNSFLLQTLCKGIIPSVSDASLYSASPRSIRY